MQNQVNNGNQANHNDDEEQNDADDDEEEENANNLVIPNFSSAPQDNKDEVRNFRF